MAFKQALFWTNGSYPFMNGYDDRGLDDAFGWLVETYLASGER
jgi:hypothetical protein